MSDMSSKKKELEELKAEIETELGEENFWFHEKDKERGIEGFLGASEA